MIVMDHNHVASASATVIAATAVVAAAAVEAAEAATCTHAIEWTHPVCRLLRRRLLRGSQGAGCCSTKTGQHSWTRTGQAGLLWGRPAPLRVRQPSMAVIGQLGVHFSSGMHRLPGPIAVHLHAPHANAPSDPTHLHVLPRHAIARIYSGRSATFTALAACSAAPVLLLRGPRLKCGMTSVGQTAGQSLAARRLGRNCSRLRCSRMGPCQQPALRSRPPGQAQGSAKRLSSHPLLNGAGPADVAPPPAPGCRPRSIRSPGRSRQASLSNPSWLPKTCSLVHWMRSWQVRVSPANFRRLCTVHRSPVKTSLRGGTAHRTSEETRWCEDSPSGSCCSTLEGWLLLCSSVPRRQLRLSEPHVSASTTYDELEERP